jgi:hypothetical protein
MKSGLGLVVAGFLALSMFAVAVYLWMSLGDVDMKPAGYVALIGGGLATLGLGVGLMALVFYSNRKGFDERAGASPLSDEPDGI